jgi:hypothetical protein
MTQIYFVLGTPGTSVIFLSQLLGLFVNAKGPYGGTVNQLEWINEPEGYVTPEFFYDNITYTGYFPRIFSVSAKPDFEKLRSRFPNAKFVVITHTLNDIRLITNYLVETYYKNLSDPHAEINFRNILQTHSHLFSNINCNFDDFSENEKEIFKRIIQYQKLLDGYLNITETESDSLIIIPYNDIRFKAQQVLEKLSSFVGVGIPEPAVTYYNEIYENYISFRNQYQ